MDGGDAGGRADVEGWVCVVTVDEKRELLRAAMSECPACDGDDADGVSDEDLDGWLDSHGVMCLTCGESGHDERRCPRKAATP